MDSDWIFETFMNAAGRAGLYVIYRDQNLYVGTQTIYSADGLIGAMKFAIEGALERHFENLREGRGYKLVGEE